MKLKLILISVMFILLTSCSDYGLEKLEELCLNDAGEYFAEPVEADGFFHASEDDCGGCASLMYRNYEYIEWFNTTKDRSMGNLEVNQYYRMYKAPKDNRFCNWKVENTRDREDINFCVATEPVKDLRSDYAYKMLITRDVLSKSEVITNTYQEVKHIETEERIAYRNKFALYPQKDSAFNPGRSITCSKFRVTFSDKHIPIDILR